MKKRNKDTGCRREATAHEWKSVFGSLRDVIDWALDIAVKLSRDMPDDVEAIEKVRMCFHAWLEERPCEMDVNDLLVTFATILSAIELDLGLEAVDPCELHDADLCPLSTGASRTFVHPVRLRRRNANLGTGLRAA